MRRGGVGVVLHALDALDVGFVKNMRYFRAEGIRGVERHPEPARADVMGDNLQDRILVLHR